jgi:hypothetical protein
MRRRKAFFDLRNFPAQRPDLHEFLASCLENMQQTPNTTYNLIIFNLQLLISVAERTLGGGP